MTEYLKHTPEGMVPDEHGEYVRAESLSLARAQRDVAERHLERLKRRVADLFGDVSMELDEDGVAHGSGVAASQAPSLLELAERCELWARQVSEQPDVRVGIRHAGAKLANELREVISKATGVPQ